MKNLFKRLPSFSADYSGVCNAAGTMDCLIVLHGQGGCNGGVTTCDDFDKDFNQERMVFTKISEIDTVIGNDDKILEQVKRASEEIPCNFILICGSPIPMLIGTDWDAWVKMLEDATGKPVIALNTKGFSTYEYGEKMLFLELIHKFSEKQATKSRVNVIGDTCLSGWTDAMRTRLKGKLRKEYEEVVFWGRDAGLNEFKDMASASLNIAVSVSAIPAVVRLKELYGIPYQIGETVDLSEVAEMKKQRKGERILLVGEQLLMNPIRERLKITDDTVQVTVCNFFSMEERLMEEGDRQLDGEDAYLELLKESTFTYIVGDPLLKRFGGFEKKFIECPQIAVSSRLLSDHMEDLSGESGYTFVKKELETE